MDDEEANGEVLTTVEVNVSGRCEVPAWVHMALRTVSIHYLKEDINLRQGLKP